MEEGGVPSGKFKGPGKYYTSASVRPNAAKNHSDQPLVLGDYIDLVDSPTGGVLRFIPPGESIVVSLEIPPSGHPLEAVREWSIKYRAAGSKHPRDVDLNELAAAWNQGPEPHLIKKECGMIHLGQPSAAWWGPDIRRAIRVWEESLCRGPYPPDLLASLDPDQRLPFLPGPGPEPIPPNKRLIVIALDLTRSLEQQFDEALKRCDEIKRQMFLLAHRPIPRHGRREDRRNVLIYTLRHSAGWKIPQIAEDQFPKENQARAREKVEDSLKVVRRVVRRYWPKHPPLKPPAAD